MAIIAQKNPDITVTVVDINENRIAAWNSNNFDELPIYEPGLSEVVKEARGRNLFFSTDIEKYISNSEMGLLNTINYFRDLINGNVDR